jgi:hypothetical protein
LGSRGETRAVVLAFPGGIGEDAVRRLQDAGYDVMPAPKKDREGRGPKVNPEPSFLKKVYAALKAEADKGKAPTTEALADRLRAPIDETGDALARLAQNGLAHAVAAGLFGNAWAPGSEQRGLFANPTGHERTRMDTAPRRPADPGAMAKASTKTSKTSTARARTANKARRTSSAAPKAKTRATKPARVSKSNPLKKGSAAAKARMAELRGMQRKARPASKTKP